MGGIFRLIGDGLRAVMPALGPVARPEAPAAEDAPDAVGGLTEDTLAMASGGGEVSEGRQELTLDVAAPPLTDEALLGEEPASDAPRMTSAAPATGDFRRVESESTSSTQKRLFGNDAVLTRQRIQERTAAEKAALEALPADKRQQYERVSAQLEGDLKAKAGLQDLLLSGKLTGKTSSDGKDLLGSLEALTQRPLAEGVDRGALVRQTVREVADPAAISQMGQMTCAATSVQIMLARDNPAEYARLVGGLASPAGEVAMQNGDMLRRATGTQADDGSGRSIPSRLMQGAINQYATGKAYDNAGDRNADGTQGLSQMQVGKVVRATMDPGAQTRLASTDQSRQAAMDQIRTAVSQGKPAAAALQWGDRDANGKTHAAHEVVVDRIENGRVYYTNPHGSKESMDQAEFQRRLLGATTSS